MNEEKVIFRKGEKVSLRPVEKSDLNILVCHMNDEDTTAYLNTYHPISYEEEMTWFDGLKEKIESDIVLAVVENGSGELAGTVSLHNIKHIDGTASTGIALLKKFWGRGYGTEALKMILKYAFETLNLRKINSLAFAPNKPSIKLHLKTGFFQEGVRKKQHYRRGEYVDEIMFGLFRENFLFKEEKK